jgi:hypothetical protein
VYKKIKFILIAFVFISLNACEKDANVKLPEVESKLVINSFISPQDTVLIVKVTLSQPLYNNSNSGDYNNVSNAVVQINDGSTTKALIYNSTENYYSISASQFPIVVGGTYHLTITTPDGKNVNASTTIPTSNTSLTFSSQNINDPNQPGSDEINCLWNDPSGSEDFYRISFYDKYFIPGDIDTSYSIMFSENVSDKDNDGNIFNKNFQVSASLGELYLIHATKEYYLYHTTLIAAASSGNPFAEPVQMYSNINGGYGIFAGFNQYKLQVFL